jgi:hypothetical protein
MELPIQIHSMPNAIMTIPAVKSGLNSKFGLTIGFSI